MKRIFTVTAKKQPVKADEEMDLIFRMDASDDPIGEAFEELVPSSGPADTKAGEIVRAINRIMYRDFNDGDLFYSGYGVETCGDAVAYLCHNVPGIVNDFDKIATAELEGSSYSSALDRIAKKIAKYIIKHPKLIETPNKEDMYDYDGMEFIQDKGWFVDYDGYYDDEEDEWDEEGWDEYKDDGDYY